MGLPTMPTKKRRSAPCLACFNSSLVEHFILELAVWTDKNNINRPPLCPPRHPARKSPKLRASKRTQNGHAYACDKSGPHLLRELEDGCDRSFHVLACLALVRPQVLEHQVLQVLQFGVLRFYPPSAATASRPSTLSKHKQERGGNTAVSFRWYMSINSRQQWRDLGPRKIAAFGVKVKPSR